MPAPSRTTFLRGAWRDAAVIGARARRDHRGEPHHRRLQSRRDIAAGLGERKRPFSLLRLTGVPPLLHRVVTRWRERCVHFSLSPRCRSWSPRVGRPLPPLPGRHTCSDSGIGYWSTVLGGPLASLAIIALTFPLLNRITGPGSRQKRLIARVHVSTSTSVLGTKQPRRELSPLPGSAERSAHGMVFPRGGRRAAHLGLDRPGAAPLLSDLVGQD